MDPGWKRREVGREGGREGKDTGEASEGRHERG